MEGKSSMRALGLLIASALCCGAVTASAGPLVSTHVQGSQGVLTDVHHKPGHYGGPPWTRGNRDRDEWRASRRDDREFSSRYSERRSSCRTVYRTYFDDYSGEYVRRSARVCD
jgi:hypothetical protein